MNESTSLESTYALCNWVNEYSKNATFENNPTFVQKEKVEDFNPSLSNWDMHVYFEILNAIDQMTRLPESDRLYLDKKVATRAINLLGFLKEQLKIHPPKIINQDGEAIAYTWVEDNFKRYLSVSDYEVDLMELTHDDQDSYEEVLSQDTSIPFDKIMERLLVQTKSHST